MSDITWNEYFFGIAEVVALKSKDSNSKVGAVIVSADNLILSTGFNDMARGVYDDEDLLQDRDEKLKWICHAETNAIINAVRVGVSLKNCHLYVTKFPCLACCNAIVQAGIVEIFTQDDSYWKRDPSDKEHTRKANLLKQAGVKVNAPFHPDYSPRTITLDWLMRMTEQARKHPQKQVDNGFSLFGWTINRKA
jgi:dCMP deaminase